MSEETYDSMPREDMEFSVASQLAYQYYDNNNDDEQIQRALDTYLEGYTFDPEYSNNNASTFIRPDGTTILAYRGTRPTNLDDLNTDASIAAGQHRTDIPHPRFVEAQNHYNFVKSKYDFVDLTGHSLGGSIAGYVGRMNNERVVAFNPGESPFSLSVIPASQTSKTTIYRTNTFDIVSFANSMYSHANSIRVVPQTEPSGMFDSWFNSHSLLNFLPSMDMLPISTEPDVIIPDFKPTINKEERKEIKSQERFVSNLCLEQPYLLECKKIKLKLKLKKK